MTFDIELRIKDVSSDIKTEIATRLSVELASSGLYIAQDPLLPTVAVGTGKSPRLAVLEYLSNLLYHTSVEAEMTTGTHESKQ